METITCYRPTGQKELDLVMEAHYEKWPPRLPEQPIFYPVTNEKYAIVVTRWNVQSEGIGYVTKFEVEKTYSEKYQIHTVGASHHTEWWIPAEDLDEFNSKIVGKIEVIGTYE